MASRFVAILCLPLFPLSINPTKYEFNLKVRTITYSSIKPQMTGWLVKGVLNLSICCDRPLVEIRLPTACDCHHSLSLFSDLFSL